MPSLPSEVTFGALLQYSVRGQGHLSRRSRDVRTAIKTDGVIGQIRVIEHAAMRVREHLAAQGCLSQCLGPEVALVPMPRSALLKEGSLWPALVLCEALCQQGAGALVLPYLRREAPVQKAATAARGERPGPEDHYRTTTVVEPLALDRLRAVTIVDDIVTRGSSFVGVVPHLTAVFPAIPVHCFALMRTISQGDIETILAPVTGRITYVGGQLRREP